MATSPPQRETWTLRRQFVVPLGLLILAIAGLISWSTAWVNQILESRNVALRFDQVSQQLIAANYPLNPATLTQISNYSGLDVILVTRGNRPIASSLEPRQTAFVLEALMPTSVSPSQRKAQVRLYRFPGFETDVFAQVYQMNSPVPGAEYSQAVLLLPQSQLARQRTALVWAPAVAGIISVIVTMLAASWIASKLVRRIELLETRVEDLSTANYQAMTLPGPRDALFRLSERINSLAQQLGVAHEVIAKTERARLISLVASGLAHEIRNSITGASLLIESVMRDDGRGTAAGTKRELDNAGETELQMALNELTRASSSIKRILASDPNTTLLDESDLTLAQIVASLKQAVEPQAQHHQVSLTLPKATDDRLIAQGSAILTCLLNLTLNAIEAAGPGGSVEVQLSESHHEVNRGLELRACVWDNGPGPPAEIAPDIAEPFVTSKREGVGLGLAMVQRVAAQRRGRLQWFRQDNRTCFLFAFPLDNQPHSRSKKLAGTDFKTPAAALDESP